MPNVPIRWRKIENIDKTRQDILNSITLLDLAAIHNYSLVKHKSTRKSKVFKKDNEVILIHDNSTASNPNNYFYSNPNDDTDKGDLFAFCINKNITSNFMESVMYLLDLDLSIQPTQKIKKFKTKTTTPTFKPSKVFPIDINNYLVKERNIPIEVLRTSLFSNRIYSTNYGLTEHNIKHAIFPLYDIHDQSKIVGQQIRNIAFKEQKEEKLKTGSNKNIGLWTSNTCEDSNKIAIFENPIDAISHFVLFPKELLTYKATIGNPSKPIIDHLAQLTKSDHQMHLVLAGDNDNKGQLFDMKFLSQILHHDTGANFQCSANLKHDLFNITISELSNEQFNRYIKNIQSVFQSDPRFTMSFTSQKNEILISTSFENNALNSLKHNLVNIFAVNHKVSSIKSISKDFNQDLQNKIEQSKKKNKPLFQRILKGLSF